MSHESKGKSDEWYTPKYIFDALDCVFDMDVASPKEREFCNVPASVYISEDSLNKQWNGFIWMNPPYGNNKVKNEWANNFISHANGIALMPDRTSSGWWQFYANASDAVLMINHRIKFIDRYGNEGSQPANGSTLFGIGERAVEALKNVEKKGLGILFFKR